MEPERQGEMRASTHEAPPATRDERATAGAGAVLLTIAGLAAAFGTAACCGLPLILAGLGLGSAWLIRPAVLAAPHLTLLLATAPVLLACGAALLWRQSRRNCDGKAICARPAVRALTLLCLLIGVVLLALGYAYKDG